MTAPRTPTWPGGKRCAFALFDDTDLTTLENGPPVYRLLTDLGIRATKSVWPLAPPGEGRVGGATLDDPAYRDWVLQLCADGHEPGFHNATDASSDRGRTEAALDRFREVFGHDPACGANHNGNAEAIYCGPNRLGGNRRRAYDALSGRRNQDRFHGEDEGSEWFWGDLCRDRVRYWRNFTFGDIDTLRASRGALPYHDPSRPYVRRWFSGTDAPHAPAMARFLTEANLDRLEASGGCCIAYTHLGAAFWEPENGHLNLPARAGFERLARRDWWFAPVGEVLDHLTEQGFDTTLDPRALARLEWRWIRHKLRSRATV